MDFLYSFMRIENYDEIFRLLELFPEISLNNADEKERINAYLLRNPNQSLICKLSDKIIGTIMCGNDGRRAFIYHLAVLPEYRRKGIGTELVRRAIEIQKQLGIDKCAIFILNENISGEKFWSNIGFSLVREAETMTKNI